MTAPDEFDALLEPAPTAVPPAAPPAVGVPPAASPPAPPPAHPGHTLGGHVEHPPLGAAELQAQPSWDEFVAGWPLYRDPVACAVIAGAALGALGVFVVLRRAVFVTATLSQAAGLGVAPPSVVRDLLTARGRYRGVRAPGWGLTLAAVHYPPGALAPGASAG